MNLFKYTFRQFARLKIDLLTQRTFLAGDVPSIDNSRIIKTASTNYEELEIIFFKHAVLNKTDVIIDVGCGKGRVFNYLLYKGLKNKMVGFEINKAVGNQTQKRLSRFKNVEIKCENIFDDFPCDGNIFYLYNPFKEDMIKQFIGHILDIAEQHPMIIYNNPVHLDIFKNNERFTCDLFTVPVARYGYTFSFARISLTGL